MSSLSQRGPLPAFGGTPSKSIYICSICGKQVRRDRIRERYGSYVDMTVLSKTDKGIREQAMARLIVDKRKHTEGVKDFFDANKKLPVDYDNKDFWVKAQKTESDQISNIFAKKRNKLGLSCAKLRVS